MDEAYKCTTNVQMVERGLNIRNLMTETLLVDTVDSVLSQSSLTQSSTLRNSS